MKYAPPLDYPPAGAHFCIHTTSCAENCHRIVRAMWKRFGRKPTGIDAWRNHPTVAGHRVRIWPVRFENVRMFELFIARLEKEGFGEEYRFALNNASEPDTHTVGSIEALLGARRDSELASISLFNAERIYHRSDSSYLSLNFRSAGDKAGSEQFFVDYSAIAPERLQPDWGETGRTTPMEDWIDQYTKPLERWKLWRRTPVVFRGDASDLERRALNVRVGVISAVVSVVVSVLTAVVTGFVI